MRSAADSGALEEVGADLQALETLLENSEELKLFLSHPFLSAEEQTRCVENLFKGKAHDLTLNFLLLLVHRERLADLPAIVPAALDLWREQQGILPVTVVAAQDLEEAQKKELVSKLAGRTGKTIELRCEVDPALLGGFQLHYSGTVEDYSLATKLETFKRNVLNA